MMAKYNWPVIPMSITSDFAMGGNGRISPYPVVVYVIKVW